MAGAEGGEAIVHPALDTFGRLDAVVSNAGIFDTPPTTNFPSRLATDARRPPGRQILPEPARLSGHEGSGLRPLRLHHLVGRAVRPAQLGPLRRRQSGACGVDQRNRHRGGPPRHPGQHGPAIRLFAHGRRDDRRLPGDSEFLHPSTRTRRAYGGRPGQPVVQRHPPQLFGLLRPARPVFVGLGEGWLARTWPAILRPRTSRPTSRRSRRPPEPFSIPGSIFDEVAGIVSRLGLTS